MSRVRLDWVGLTLILWSVLTRAAVNAEPLPGWDADPTQMSIAIVGIGPTGSLVCDIAAWFGAALVFLNKRTRQTRIDPLALLGFLGALCILGRTLLIDAGDTEAIRIGSSWAASWVGFAAVHSQAHRPIVRTVLGSLAAGFVMYLCSKAFVQVFVDHPNLLAQFDADPAASLMAQGIEPESAQALSYERRLRQPDPTGWFGLSNVLASFFAASLVLFAYVSVNVRGKLRLITAASAVVVGVALLMTGSKAGMAVACLGIGLVVLTRFTRGGLARLTCAGAILTPVAAVIFRGVAGVPSGDLSLLVRWFYMQGAVKLTGSELPFGTGPSGFQDAYMRAKPPEGTENVISPHMIWLDYSATLGVVAIPIIVALAWAGWRFCCAISNAETARVSHSIDRLKLLRPYVILGMVVPVLVGAWMEVEATPIENALSRLVGVLAWAGVSLMLLWNGLPSKRGLAVAGVVLLCHAQLDMNMSLPGSAPLVLLCFGLAAGTRKTRLVNIPTLPAGILAILGAGWLLLTATAVWGWESDLRTSSDRLSALVDERDEMMAQNRSREAFAELQLRFDSAAQESLVELESASAKMPSDTRVDQASARLALIISAAQASRLDRQQALAAIERAGTILSEALSRRERASIHAQLAHVRLEQIRLLKEGPVRESVVEELTSAVIARLTRASEMAPYSSRYPTSLALALSEMGDMESASRWAAEAIRRDELSALDPLMALPDSTRRRLERIARNP